MAKQPKMMICKYCGNEINAKVRKCPHCGVKVKRPIYKKWWFWVLVILVLLMASGMGSSNGNKNNGTQKIGTVSETTSTAKQDAAADSKETVKTDSEAQDTETAESVEEASSEETAESESSVEDVQTVYHVGDILKDGDMEIVYMASGDYEEDNQYSQPADGNKYIFLQFAFINTSEKSDDSISFYSFEAYADGYSAEMYYGGDEDLSATLSAGRSTSGYVYFEVPADAETIEVEYETNWFTEEKVVFVFDGNQDSGFVLEKNTAPTEGAFKVGDKAESKDLNITYLACFPDESDNMFINARDGYHFVTLEFEFENISKSDEHVSYFDFDCYADGIDCVQTYYREDGISATLSAGRKAKGTVTFEIPDDATTVEVEFVTNYWTSNRVVFTVE